VNGPAGPARRGGWLRSWLRAETLLALAVTLGLAVAYLAVRDAGPFQAIEGETLDWRFRLRGPRAASGAVTIVAIDDRTLAELGRWPFSRSWLAATIDAVAADGASVVVFDLLLVGPEVEGTAGATGQTGAGMGSDAPANPPAGPPAGADRKLRDAMARAGNVVVPYAFVYDPAEASASVLPPVIERAAFRVVHAGAGRRPPPDPPAGVLLPLAPFLTAARPAHVTIFVEADGSLRFSRPAIFFDGSYYPSLPAESARLFLGVDKDKSSLDLGRGLAIGERFFASNPELALPIDYAGPAGSFETRSLIDVAQGRFAPGSFRDKLVLIGAKSVGLGDRYRTPYDATLSGVEVFATIIDNFVGRGFLYRTSFIERLDLVAIVVAGFLAACLGMLRRPALAMLAATLVLGLWGAANLYAFIALHSWLNFTFPALTLLASASIVIAGLAVRETRQRADAERRGATLSRYVSPLAIFGLQAGTRPETEDRSQQAAVMFVDLVGFTRASEKIAPGEVADLLRRFHGGIERAAQTFGGVIDKFIGDGALVVFGLSGAGPSDAANAVLCARRIADEVAGWAAELQPAGKPALRCSAGIDLGAVSLAEVGGSEHAQITVTGDTVNVASRLEALTREWQATVIVSEAVFEALRAAGRPELLADFAELPVQTVRGRDRPLRVWSWPAPRNGPASA